MTEVLTLADAHPCDLSERVRSVPALLLPVGTLEFHGHHLPLGLDGTKAESVAREAALRSGGVLAPTSWWAADGVPGPFTLRLPATLVEALLREALQQFAGLGFRVIVIVNGHYGLQNSLSTRRAALACMELTDAVVLAIADYEVLLDLGADGDHAGVFETSLLAATRSDLVRLDAVPEGEPLPGLIGDDPRGVASPTLGRRATEHAGAAIASALRQALGLDPPARARYVAALTAAIAALERIAELRVGRTRESAPRVQTASWFAHLRAMHQGDHVAAARFAEDKRREPFR